MNKQPSVKSSRPSQAIPWQRKAAHHIGQATRLLRQNGNRDAQQIAKDELKPWIDYLQTLPDVPQKAVRHG
jgi:hypothetical protein